MSDIVEDYGVCEGEPCKRPDRIITSENELVIIGGKKYHKGCEPTAAQQEAATRSYT